MIRMGEAKFLHLRARQMSESVSTNIYRETLACTWFIIDIFRLG